MCRDKALSSYITDHLLSPGCISRTLLQDIHNPRMDCPEVGRQLSSCAPTWF